MYTMNIYNYKICLFILPFLMLGKAGCVGELLFSAASCFWLTVETELLKVEIWPLDPLSKP